MVVSRSACWAGLRLSLSYYRPAATANVLAQPTGALTVELLAGQRGTVGREAPGAQAGHLNRLIGTVFLRFAGTRHDRACKLLRSASPSISCSASLWVRFQIGTAFHSRARPSAVSRNSL